MVIFVDQKTFSISMRQNKPSKFIVKREEWNIKSAQGPLY